ncbi:MAG: PH domain-containing protein [Pseudomonadota bacterium]|uniref:PH domain-containing protein n=1 Tax=unclassified Alteromonas TaxID=2614992 RepID=UPI0019237250|nr:MULTISPECIES: PH domain-containing protein [unclassified Alteromonas]BCO17446.1 membrane protein [Alteromonas sp. KC3]BCO21424.1 membrane protein [Alteromonas sp. KC14]
MSERIIISATFNPAVKTYWLISLLLVSTITVVGIPVLIISIPLFFLISSKILAAMSAIVTERKLVVKRGVFNKEEKSIPLEKITDVAMVQGPLMRVFNLYRLSFETAGQSAQGALVSLIGINDAETFRETILAQKDKLLTGNNAMPEQKTDENNDMKVLIASVKRIELLLEKALDSK